MWAEVLATVIAGAAVSWPPVIVGLVISHRKLSSKIDDATSGQTADITQITDDQTAELLRHRHPGPPEPYHGHGEFPR